MTKKREERVSQSFSASKRDSAVSSSVVKNNQEKEESNTVDTQQKPQPDYVNRAALEELQNHDRAQVDNNDVIGANPTSASELVSRTELAKNYEIRGGFAMPKKSFSEDEESNYIPYPEFQMKARKALPTETKASQQIPAVKSKSKDAVEDPYVQAPPLKSHRCHPKSEKPHAYQTLVPNGCGSNGCGQEEGDEYNMLLHNSAVMSQDAKAFLLLNNNLKSTSLNTENKCNVILKSHYPNNTTNPESKYKINRNGLNC